jgi:hypothetical protein
LVILGGDEMAEMPIDAINSRCRPVAGGHERQLSGFSTTALSGAHADA